MLKKKIKNYIMLMHEYIEKKISIIAVQKNFQTSNQSIKNRIQKPNTK